MTAEEFELAYAARSGVTVEWLRAHGHIVAPCRCGEDGCDGWQSISRELYEDLKRTMPWLVDEEGGR